MLEKADGKSENTFRFLHASDLHLGAKQYRAKNLSHDFIEILKRILKLGQNLNVDCILFAGDVFTSIDLLPGLYLQVIQTLTQFSIESPNIKILAIEGNHDLRHYSHGNTYIRGQSWLKTLSELGFIYLLDGIPTYSQETPSKIHFFYNYNGEKYSGPVKIKFTEIFGTHYHNQIPVTQIQNLQNTFSTNPKYFRILLQHFGVAGTMKGIPGIPFRKLSPLSRKIDYLALGHFHKSYRLNQWIFNPGSPEAVSASEHRFTRGVFFGEIRQLLNNSKISYKKNVKLISLPNRPVLWVALRIPRSFSSDKSFYDWIIDNFRQKFYNQAERNPISPNSKFANTGYRTYLTLSGCKPPSRIKFKPHKYEKKIYEELSLESMPIASLRIFTRFNVLRSQMNKYYDLKKFISVNH